MTKNNKSGVFEIANRVSTNSIKESSTVVVNGLTEHKDSNNSSAHQIGNIVGLWYQLGIKEPAFVKSTAFNKNFGAVAGTVCEGNDSRLSDSREPRVHVHTIENVTGLQTALNGKQDVISGYTGYVSVVVDVDFTAQTVTTVEIKIVNGIITEIN